VPLTAVWGAVEGRGIGMLSASVARRRRPGKDRNADDDGPDAQMLGPLIPGRFATGFEQDLLARLRRAAADRRLGVIPKRSSPRGGLGKRSPAEFSKGIREKNSRS